VVVIIQLIPQITPLTPITSILPLAFVLVVSAVKEAIEDIQRYKADKKNNKEIFKVLREGQLQKIFSQEIKAGDIVKVKRNQHFPADIVVLSTCNDDGSCYVKTANLDGETNLKMRKALDVTSKIKNSLEMMLALSGSVQCETPNERLYQFNGRYVSKEGKSVYSLNQNQLLHRVCPLPYGTKLSGSPTTKYKVHIWIGSLRRF
jgi:magnesium-transporting ATPase (P-type)